MEEKYVQAIKAGIICGIILVVLSIIYIGVERLVFGSYFSEWMGAYGTSGYTGSEVPAFLIISAIFTFVMIFLGSITFFGAGVLSAIFTSSYIRDKNDALIYGALSGAVAELVHRPFAMLINMTANFFSPLNGPGIESAVTGLVSDLICCLPFLLVVGIVLGAIGSVTYGIIKLKI
ncbi:hypothetical protein CUJ83_08900 [Methanocella sp. CWC-04]|uniref:Uncharacterized protein n=1 Tax=Methanooceanicella nereidis TaxID=2052831 RepID=A0AAP2RCN6_9EURY|nr:hypothetical protein [Methanocella sp. CWC-04]MCD1295114.1 hypothetical protein [Methanocella sp. CWC-04]